jgi:hypothetical protein
MTNSNGTSENINITLRNPNNKNKSSSSESNTTLYIIELNKKYLLINQTLQTDIGYCKRQIEQKDVELEDKDDEMGRVEKSNVYLKGLLKNFLEMSKLHQEISENRKNISDNNYKSLKYLKKEIKCIRYTVHTIYGLFIALGFMIIPSYLLFFAFVIYSLIPIGVIEYYIEIFDLPNHKHQEDIITNTLKQIKELDSSQDYIHEFIEQV